MLDIIFVAAILALAALVLLVARGREAVIVFAIIAAALSVAAIGYVIVALVRPEKF